MVLLVGLTWASNVVNNNTITMVVEKFLLSCSLSSYWSGHSVGVIERYVYNSIDEEAIESVLVW